ncbi:GAF domain-containing protein [Pantoea sp. 18069]|uniref:GAF domain-containing protein n=1 Tax=Pantoea sp. 18069 TaxID=2681415 RepID=UPI00135906BA|nr:GAF domain-containing protein [Pantoea sp. 18069]
MSEDCPLTLPSSAGLALCRELPRAPDFAAALQIIERVRQDLLGDGLLTVNHVQWPAHGDTAEAIDLQRIWSSRPAEYPLAGRKRKGLTPWTRQLLLSSEIFIGEGQAALQQVFDDHRLILSMGLQSVMNVPLVRADGCFATFNVLGTRAQWSALERQQIELLAALALPWVAGHSAHPGS